MTSFPVNRWRAGYNTANPYRKGDIVTRLGVAYIAKRDTLGHRPFAGSLYWDVLAPGSIDLNVKTFGAVGDGLVDDTAAVQAALDTAVAGQVIELPAGTYAVNDVTITTAGVTLRGAGATLKKNGDTGAILTVNADQVTVEGVTFDGQNGAFPASGQDMVAVTSRSDVTIRDCRFIDGTTWGLHLVGNERLTQRITVRDCYFGPGSATFTGLFANVGLEDVLITGCSFVVGDAGGGIGVRSYAAATTQRIRILDNTITIDGDTDSFGVAVATNDSNNPLDVVIAHNTIVCTGDANMAFSVAAMSGGAISNNTVTCDGASQVNYGLELAGDHVEVVGNSFSGGGALGTAIILNNASDCLIANNSIRELVATGGARGIQLFADNDHATSRNVVANNHVELPVYISGGDAKGIEVVANDVAPTILADNSIIGNTIRSLDPAAHIGIGVLAQGAVVGPVIRTLIADNLLVSGNVGIQLDYDSTTTLRGNRMDSVAYRFYNNNAGTGIIQEANSWQYATAVPDSGDWFLGDKVWNTSPAANDPPGWVCVAAGTPGTWAAMPDLVAL